MLAQLLANGLVTGCLYALVALGFALIYNTTRIFHIAHGAIYTTSAYLLYFFLIVLKWPLVLTVLASLVFTAMLGALAEFLIYAPLSRKKASLLIALLSSIGLYTIIVNIIAMIAGNESKVLRPGVEKTYEWGSVILTRVQVAEVIAFLLIFPALLFVLKKTSWGKAIRAVRDNPTLSEVMGINLSGIRYSVFIVGSCLAGVAAMLQSLDVGMDPNVGMPMFLVAAVAVIIGGVGIFEGAVLGAFLIGVLQSLVVWKTSSRWVDAFVFLILILFLIFRPEGILGHRKRVEEVLSE